MPQYLTNAASNFSYHCEHAFPHPWLPLPLTLLRMGLLLCAAKGMKYILFFSSKLSGICVL